MRFNLALAFLVSILLIGGASWSRFANQQKAEAELIAVETQRQQDSKYYEEVVLPVLEKSAATLVPIPEKLNSADLIGRQLLAEYVALATQGGANDANLNLLADRYIESVPTLVTAESVVYSDIKVVGVNANNLLSYAEKLAQNQAQYAQKSGQLNPLSMGANGFGAEYYKVVSSLAKIYRETATDLTNMDVPTVLVESHINLINAYLANAAATDAMLQGDQDPAQAFAGMIRLAESIAKEQSAINKIAQTLSSIGQTYNANGS